ncbi:BlaI/MecI/CopY family transcriptional regulator [Singulisphaera rosea]
MAKSAGDPLSRRERQIMDVIYQTGRSTAAEVREALSDPPSYSAVRTLLRVLEEKGQLRHEQEGPRYVYLPTVPRDKARRSALKRLVQTFFEGSTAQAVAALLGEPNAKLTDEDLDRLSSLIEQARNDGR